MQNRIRQIRKYLGLTQMQFAQRLNRTPGSIAHLEAGRCAITQATIHAICSEYGINEAWLVSGSGDMFAEGCDVKEADKKNAGERIRFIRKRAGLTQQEFARAIGYSMMQISFVELGKTTPSNNFLHKTAQAFNVRFEWLMTGSGPVEAEEAKVDGALIDWLKQNPEIVQELRKRAGLDNRAG